MCENARRPRSICNIYLVASFTPCLASFYPWIFGFALIQPAKFATDRTREPISSAGIARIQPAKLATDRTRGPTSSAGFARTLPTGLLGNMVDLQQLQQMQAQMAQLAQANVNLTTEFADTRAQLAAQLAALSASSSAPAAPTISPTTFVETKIRKQPENFAGLHSDWGDWSFQFKAYIASMDERMANLMNEAATLDGVPMTRLPDDQTRSKQLCYIMALFFVTKTSLSRSSARLPAKTALMHGDS